MISPLAYIHPEAKIGENVEIAPFVFIDKNVVIGDNNKIMANANILYGSRIGNGNTIFPGAVIGAIPQDLKLVTTIPFVKMLPSIAVQLPKAEPLSVTTTC